MTRQLIMVDWEDERAVSTLPLYIPPCVSPRMNLVTLLHLLRKGGSLIAFICAGKLCMNLGREENICSNLLMALYQWRFVGPHLATKALNDGKGEYTNYHFATFEAFCHNLTLFINLLAIPPEAGFMGIVTLQDVLESVLQERIYDEEDISQRHLAGAGKLLYNFLHILLQFPLMNALLFSPDPVGR